MGKEKIRKERGRKVEKSERINRQEKETGSKERKKNRNEK